MNKKIFLFLGTLTLLILGCGGSSGGDDNSPSVSNSSSGGSGSGSDDGSSGDSNDGSSGGSNDVCDAPGSPSDFVELNDSITYRRRTSGNETFWYCLKEMPSTFSVVGATSCGQDGYLDFRLYDSNNQRVNGSDGSISGNVNELKYQTSVYKNIGQGKYFLEITLGNSADKNRHEVFFTADEIDRLYPNKWFEDKGISLRDCSDL